MSRRNVPQTQNTPRFASCCNLSDFGPLYTVCTVGTVHIYTHKLGGLR